MLHRFAVAALGLSLCLSPAAPAVAQSFTLQQVMSAPFTSELQAAPQGNRLLWIANQEGKRNIWVAEKGGSAWTVHRVTNDDADDGIDLGDIVWTPDGETASFTSAAATSNSPRSPHPIRPCCPRASIRRSGSSPPAAAMRASLRTAARPPFLPMARPSLTSTRTRSGPSICAMQPPNPRSVIHTRGRLASLTWSPDGKYLSFASERGDHGFIGVYSIADHALRYLDPSTEIDRDPVWSPDSHSIAFVRIPPDTSGVEFKPRRTAQPWSIIVADAATGAGHAIWHAHDGQGSVFHGTEADRQLYWTAGNHIVFPWESNGWLNLYSVDAERRHRHRPHSRRL